MWSFSRFSTVATVCVSTILTARACALVSGELSIRLAAGSRHALATVAWILSLVHFVCVMLSLHIRRPSLDVAVTVLGPAAVVALISTSNDEQSLDAIRDAAAASWAFYVAWNRLTARQVQKTRRKDEIELAIAKSRVAKAPLADGDRIEFAERIEDDSSGDSQVIDVENRRPIGRKVA